MAVTDIYSLADDALQNMFEVTFVSDPASGNRPDGNMTLRVTEFQKPETGVETYEVNYKALKITKPTGKTSFSNEFSFTMRIDQNYDWYKFFENWNKAVLDTKDGTMYGDSADANLRVDVKVQPDNASGYWSFIGCFPKTVPSISYSQDSGEPVTAEINFACMRMSTLEGT